MSKKESNPPPKYPKPPAPPAPPSNGLTTREHKPKKLWLVGKWKECESCETSMQMQGLYDDETLAASSVTKDDYFVVEFNANEALPDETVICRVAWYPMAETKEEGIKRMEEESAKSGKPLG